MSLAELADGPMESIKSGLLNSEDWGSILVQSNVIE
jgi:hypothetical protein